MLYAVVVVTYQRTQTQTIIEIRWSNNVHVSTRKEK